MNGCGKHMHLKQLPYGILSFGTHEHHCIGPRRFRPACRNDGHLTAVVFMCKGAECIRTGWPSRDKKRDTCAVVGSRGAGTRKHSHSLEVADQKQLVCSHFPAIEEITIKIEFHSFDIDEQNADTSHLLDVEVQNA